jgi:hypothetical protein
VLLALAGRAYGTEPNETFNTRTVLGSGVLSVADELSLLSYPDTVLRVWNQFGGVYQDDDDSSPLGDGYASAVYGAPTNSGSLDFTVSGWDDYDFVGSHVQAGFYEVFVDVFDFFGDPVDSFSEVRALQPGVTHDFFFDGNFDWESYDVYIDNTVGGGDVDFFTFTGLTPGEEFTARTQDPNETNIDTYLGWFNSAGSLVAANDDEDFDNGIFTSLLTGNVPANGMLTFAVTGFGDETFFGDHEIEGMYELELEFASAELPGDFNDDGAVNAADYVVWRKGLGTTYTQAHFNEWRANFGETAGAGAASAVPEPASLLLLAVALAAHCMSKWRFRL